MKSAGFFSGVCTTLFAALCVTLMVGVLAEPESPRAASPLLPATTPAGSSAQTAAAKAPAEEDDPQLPLLEAIRSDRPEQLFELLKETGSQIPESRALSLQSLAHYRLGDFQSAAQLLARLDPARADALFLQSLLLASEGRLTEAERLLSSALSRQTELGLLAFEAGLLENNLLQHLNRFRDAAGVVDQFLPDAPFGKPALRSIRTLLAAAPAEPYRVQAVAQDHTVRLLADGSLPARTVMVLEPEQQGRLVLFDTGSSLTLFKADLRRQSETEARALGLSYEANTDFQYAWHAGVTLGGWQVGDIPVGLIDRKSEQAAQLNYEAVFALPFLRRFFVVFDFPARSMQLLAHRPESVEGDAIPFRYVADQIILTASINGKRATLLLDTGLGLPSMKLDVSWAQGVTAPAPDGAGKPTAETGGSSNNSRQEPPKPAQPQRPVPPGSVGPVPALETQIHSLKFGNQEMKALPVTLDPLRRRLNQNPLAVRIDGILAAPMLQDYVVSIDFDSGQLYFLKKTDAR